jgi:hypothetical protein
MANVIGGRIFTGHNVIKQNIFGAITLSAACALPFAGWFLMLPYVGLVGIGAVILGFFQKGE